MWKIFWDKNNFGTTGILSGHQKSQPNFEGGGFTSLFTHFRPLVVVSSRMKSGSIIFQKERWKHLTTDIGIPTTDIGIPTTDIGLSLKNILVFINEYVRIL